MRDSAMRKLEIFIDKIGDGKPFFTSELSFIASRDVLDAVLTRMTRTGKLSRLRRGMYVSPRKSDLFGTLPPSVRDILDAVSRKTGEKFEISGEAALSALKLTTQNQAGGFVFSTTGHGRVLRFDSFPDIVLKRTISGKGGDLFGSSAGVALAALLKLGKDAVDDEVLRRVVREISEKEFSRLAAYAPSFPSWLSDLLFKYAGRYKHA